MCVLLEIIASSYKKRIICGLEMRLWIHGLLHNVYMTLQISRRSFPLFFTVQFIVIQYFWIKCPVIFIFVVSANFSLILKSASYIRFISNVFFLVLGKNPSGKKNPDPKPNPIPSLTLALPLTPHGRTFFRGDFFLAPAFFSYPQYDNTIKR